MKSIYQKAEVLGFTYVDIKIRPEAPIIGGVGIIFMAGFNGETIYSAQAFLPCFIKKHDSLVLDRLLFDAAKYVRENKL